MQICRSGDSGSGLETGDTMFGDERHRGSGKATAAVSCARQGRGAPRHGCWLGANGHWLGASGWAEEMVGCLHEEVRYGTRVLR